MSEIASSARPRSSSETAPLAGDQPLLLASRHVGGGRGPVLDTTTFSPPGSALRLEGRNAIVDFIRGPSVPLSQVLKTAPAGAAHLYVQGPLIFAHATGQQRVYQDFLPGFSALSLLRISMTTQGNPTGNTVIWGKGLPREFQVTADEARRYLAAQSMAGSAEEIDQSRAGRALQHSEEKLQRKLLGILNHVARENPMAAPAAAKATPEAASALARKPAEVPPIPSGAPQGPDLSPPPARTRSLDALPVPVTPSQPLVSPAASEVRRQQEQQRLDGERRAAETQRAAATARATTTLDGQAQALDDLGARLGKLGTSADALTNPALREAGNMLSALIQRLTRMDSLDKAFRQAKADGGPVTVGGEILQPAAARRELASLRASFAADLKTLRGDVAALERAAESGGPSAPAPTLRPLQSITGTKPGSSGEDLTIPSGVRENIGAPATKPLPESVKFTADVQEIAEQNGLSPGDIAALMAQGMSAEQAAAVLNGAKMRARGAAASSPAGSGRQADGPTDLAQVTAENVDTTSTQRLGILLDRARPQEMRAFQAENPELFERILTRLYSAFDERMRPRPGLSPVEAADTLAGLVSVENVFRRGPGGLTATPPSPLATLTRGTIAGTTVLDLAARVQMATPDQIRAMPADLMGILRTRLDGAVRRFYEAPQPTDPVLARDAARATAGLQRIEEALGRDMGAVGGTAPPTGGDTAPNGPLADVRPPAKRSLPNPVTARAIDPITGEPLAIQRSGTISQPTRPTAQPVPGTGPQPLSPYPDDHETILRAASPNGEVWNGTHYTAPVYQGVDKPPMARGSVMPPSTLPYFSVTAANGVSPGETSLRDGETRFVSWVASTFPWLGGIQSNSIGFSDASLSMLRRFYKTTSNVEATRRFFTDLMTPAGPGREGEEALERTRHAANLAASFSTRTLDLVRNLTATGASIRADETLELKPEDLTSSGAYHVRRNSKGEVTGATLNTERMSLGEAIGRGIEQLEIGADGRIDDFFGNQIGRVQFSDASQRERFASWLEGGRTAPVWVSPSGDLRLEGATGPEAVLGRVPGSGRMLHVLQENWNVSTGVVSIGMQFGVRLPGIGEMLTFSLRQTTGTGATGASNVSFQVPRQAVFIEEVVDRVNAQLGGLFAGRRNAIVGRPFEESIRFNVGFSTAGRISDATSRPLGNALIRGLDGLFPGTRNFLESSLGWPRGLIPPSGYPSPLEWANPANLGRNIDFLRNGRGSPAEAFFSPYISRIITNPMVTPRQDAGEPALDGEGRQIFDPVELPNGEKPPSKTLLEGSFIPFTLRGTGSVLPPMAVGTHGIDFAKLPEDAKGLQLNPLAIGSSSIQGGISVVRAWNPEKPAGELRLRLPNAREVTIPTPARIILRNPEGGVVDPEGFVNRDNEERSFGVTAVFDGPGSAPVQLPAQVAYAVNPQVLSWGPHSATQMEQWLTRLEASSDPEVRDAAMQARQVFEARPIRRGGTIKPDERAAVDRLVRFGADRVNTP